MCVCVCVCDLQSEIYVIDSVLIPPSSLFNIPQTLAQFLASSPEVRPCMHPAQSCYVCPRYGHAA